MSEKCACLEYSSNVEKTVSNSAILPPPKNPIRLTSITGVPIDDAFATGVPAEMKGIPVFILSKEALIRNKRAIGRPQDLADLETLED
jgi:hypothetical protein